MKGCITSQELFSKGVFQMNKFFAMLSISLASAVSIAEEVVRITQSEIERVVDEEVLLSLHPDDARASIDYLREQGAGNRDIADAIVRILRENYNAPKDEEGSVKANSAIHWLEVLGDQNQMSNLLFVAQVSTNVHASSAIRAFYRRTANKREFVDAAENLLSRPRMDQLKSTVWDLLEKEAEGPQRARVVAIANSRLRSGFIDFYNADIILSRWQNGYADGILRKKLLKEALGDQALKSVFPAAYNRLKMRSTEGDKQ